MTDQTSPIQIKGLSFTGREVEPASLEFPKPLSFVYGASNTGKSFAAKSLDFMLGGNSALPDIVERRPYNRIILDLMVAGNLLKLERFIGGGDFEVHFPDGAQRVLAQRHNADNYANLSNFLLQNLGITGREIARDKSGTKKPLSFRDLVRFCITDETSIQSEVSPVESGDKILATIERNTFKYMLTGEDDSALITQEKPAEFKTGKSAQLRFITEMLAQIETEIAEDYPDIDQLVDLEEAIEDQLKAIEEDIVAARASVSGALDRKRKLTSELSTDQQRITDIALSIENFEQLQRVYSSDIARLESLEEASFLFGVDAKRACRICGAPPEAQVHDHGLAEIERARSAAEAEIVKIRLHQDELVKAIDAAHAELTTTGERILANRAELQAVEKALSTASPNAHEQQRRFTEIIPKRDRINRGLALLARREELEKQHSRIEKAKRVVPKTNYQAGLSLHTGQEFANEVASVLAAWGFPGNLQVQFDHTTYDLIIDSKHRRDNGKGVRAITHAAFKVAMLTYCRARKLPHPGFLVLDTPLITYRDPIRSTLGELTDEEREITKIGLKEKFFAHLSSLEHLGQFILFDNADPPEGAANLAHIETFTNDPGQGRQGLFKVQAPLAELNDLLG